MFNRLRSVVSGAVEGMESSRSLTDKQNTRLPHKHKYMRPAFLNLSEDALTVSKDKKVRPVLSSSSSNPLPFNTGYAECVNAGKSSMNEDMAQVYHATIKYQIRDFVEENHVVEYAYYAIFDGHAGYGAALDASKQLHHIIHQKLVDSIDTIISLENGELENPVIDSKSLIIGCLETSFAEMDEVIKESRNYYYNPGGCTAIVALFMLGNLYVANAGDCRACICDGNDYIEMSNDYSPAYDRERIYRKADENISLLGERYTVREFLETPTKDDLGKIILYKDPHMIGWSFKTLTYEDLKLPLISGFGRRSRIMGTIGVARGFGDFDLTSNHYKIAIKPFLSCLPEVKVFNVDHIKNDSAVLVMASDGLWDAVETRQVLDLCDPKNDRINDRNVNITKAMNLVAAARGKKDISTNMWMLPKSNNNNASLDDISVFVIYVKHSFSYQTMNGTQQSSENSIRSSSPIEISDTESGSTPPGSPVAELADNAGSPECDLNSEQGLQYAEESLKGLLQNVETSTNEQFQ